jgi:hypothetical protein
MLANRGTLAFRGTARDINGHARDIDGHHTARAHLASRTALTPAASPLSASSTPNIVGTVTALGGTKDVKLRATADVRYVEVKVGTKLTLEATILMGRRGAATLRGARPAGVPTSRDLVYVRSATDAKHLTTLSENAHSLIVRIRPA